MKAWRIAIVNQPWLSSVPVPTSSLEIWTYEVGRRLAKTNDVHVFGGMPARAIRGQRFRSEGVTYHLTSTTVDAFMGRLMPKLRRSVPADRPLVARQSYYFFWATRVAWQLRRLKPDVIHIHNQFPFARIIGRLNPQAKLILHMHSEWLSQVDGREVEPAVRRSSLVVGCSRHVISRAEAREEIAFPSREVVPNGVDTEMFVPVVTTSEPSDPRPLSIVFIGRVSPEKGCHTLIEAFQELSASHEGVTLTMVGPIGALPVGHIVAIARDERIRNLQRFYDPPKSYVAQILERVSSQYRDRLTFTGNLSRGDVAKVIRNADVVINPSLSETFGMSLVEAMASGVPVVATRVGGMPEIVEDGETGYLVPPEHPAALARAIGDLLSDPAKRRRMGVAGRRRALDSHTWDAVAERTADVYRSLVLDPAPVTVAVAAATH